jgi:Winged helix-turn helix
MDQSLWDEGLKDMAAWRRAIKLSLGDADSAKLRSIAHSRTQPASRAERARILLAYREDPSFFAVGRRLGLHHQTVQRCLERAVAEGPMAALDDRPRPGKERTITLEAKTMAGVVGVPEGKGIVLSARTLDDTASGQPREHGPAEGHACLARLAQRTVCKILGQEDVKPHKVRYYLERRDPDFAEEMAEVLCVYRKVKLLKKPAAASGKKPSDAAAVRALAEHLPRGRSLSEALELNRSKIAIVEKASDERAVARGDEQLYLAQQPLAGVPRDSGGSPTMPRS